MQVTEARTAVARVVCMGQDHLDLYVVASTSGNTMAHPKTGDEVLVKKSVGISRDDHEMPRCANTKTRPRSWWCKVDSAWVSCSTTRHSKSVGWVFITGAGPRHVL